MFQISEGFENHVKTLAKENATIGANATNVCSHIIGTYAMVAAGAVMSKDVLDYALVAEIPARVIGMVDDIGEDEKFL